MWQNQTPFTVKQLTGLKIGEGYSFIDLFFDFNDLNTVYYHFYTVECMKIPAYSHYSPDDLIHEKRRPCT